MDQNTRDEVDQLARQQVLDDNPLQDRLVKGLDPKTVLGKDSTSRQDDGTQSATGRPGICIGVDGRQRAGVGGGSCCPMWRRGGVAE